MKRNDLNNNFILKVKELEQAKCTLVAHDWGGAVAWNFVTVNFIN